MRIGVLALQGDVREHLEALNRCGVEALPVKHAEEIESIAGLVIPGGESTTISKLAVAFGLDGVIRRRIETGLPVYGSCAGMIMVASTIMDPASNQESFGGLDMVVRRNAFGRQVDSFEADLSFKGIDGPVRAVFIRAPWVESLGNSVEVLASVEVDGVQHPVAVRSKSVLATSFHPELTGDDRVHRYFIEEICGQ